MKRVNQDVYWSYKNTKYHNKWDLLSSAKDDLTSIKFNYFDKDFSEFNWLAEPVQSWAELLKARALQLREKYDYIRLFYSGGVDSQTMLETFIENNIHLDEILIFRGSAWTDNLNEDPAEAEIVQVALPYLSSIKTKLVGTKVTTLETNASLLNKLVNEEYFYEESTFALRVWRERHLYRLHPELWRPYDQGHYHCDLRGGDKPRVFKENDGYYMGMWDGSRGWEIGDQFLENFYLSPEFPEIHSKQCHLVKNHLKETLALNESIRPFFNVFDGGEIETINKLCRVPRFREVNLGKGTSGVASSKQMMQLEGAKIHNKRLYDIWHSFINNEGSANSYRFNNNNIWDDFVGILSKKYFLGE